jgi:hypothetical protein
LCLTLSAAVIAGVAFGQAIGAIHVTVLDERQSPVAAAMVTAHHAGEFEDMWPGLCTTAEDGTCTMHIQGPGRFAVEASKFADQYPQRLSFYFGKNFKEQVVELRAADSIVSAVIHVGPRAGVIKGKVFDAVSGKSLVGSAELHWVADQDIWMQTGIGELSYPLLIPADVPLTLVVSRQGYEDWKYSTRRGALKPILLHSGRELRLNIRLMPKH